MSRIDYIEETKWNVNIDREVCSEVVASACEWRRQGERCLLPRTETPVSRYQNLTSLEGSAAEGKLSAGAKYS